MISDILYRFLIPISHVAWSPIKCNTSLILKIDIRVGISTNDVASDILCTGELITLLPDFYQKLQLVQQDLQAL